MVICKYHYVNKEEYIMVAVERENPRISINKISEYVTALPSRRRTIIKQQKRPPSFIVPYYKDAETTVVEYLTSPEVQAEWLDLKIQELSNKSVSTEWEENRRNICIDALDSFVEFMEELDFGNLSCIIGEPKPEKLNIAGVQISVRPEIYLIDKDRNVKGCVKLVLGKGREVSADEAGYTGVCLQRWMMEKFNVSNNKTCFLIDIFGGVCHIAPKAYRKKMSDIEAACEEIVRAWANA
jgi:hypothetical protein